MGSWIDARTRENPEAAMVHHNERYQGYANQLNHSAANPLYNSFGTPMCSDTWSCPVAEHEFQATELLHSQLREAQKARSSEAPKPEPQHFDTEAHRAFMRGLG